MAWTTPVLVSRPAGVRVLLWDRWACEGEREGSERSSSSSPAMAILARAVGVPCKSESMKSNYASRLPTPAGSAA
jgi:hypothetical protein